MKPSLCGFLAAAMLLPAAVSYTASIKPSPSDSTGSDSNSDNGYLRMRNVTLRRCIGIAYGFPVIRILEGPKWLDESHFDIVARADEQGKGGDIKPMLQAVLADRFGLLIHHETRSLPGYALTVTKGGIKAKTSTPDAAGTPPNSRTGGLAPGGLGRRDNYHDVRLDQFAVRLADNLGAPVEDATGVKESFDFSLTWSPGETQAKMAGAEFAQGLSLFTALQEQLGLKLESRKVPTDMLVIDHAELPSEN